MIPWAGKETKHSFRKEVYLHYTVHVETCRLKITNDTLYFS